jgi:hypothetical protein
MFPALLWAYLLDTDWRCCHVSIVSASISSVWSGWLVSLSTSPLDRTILLPTITPPPPNKTHTLSLFMIWGVSKLGMGSAAKMQWQAQCWKVFLVCNSAYRNCNIAMLFEICGQAQFSIQYNINGPWLIFFTVDHTCSHLCMGLGSWSGVSVFCYSEHVLLS